MGNEIIGFDVRACTITTSATGEGRYVRQSSSVDSYGHVVIRIEPHQGRRDFLLEWAVDEDVIPMMFRPGVVAGIQAVAAAGYPDLGPLVNIKVTVIGGSTNAVDSHLRAYEVATSIAFQNALARAQITTQGTSREDILHGDEEDVAET